MTCKVRSSNTWPRRSNWAGFRARTISPRVPAGTGAAATIIKYGIRGRNLNWERLPFLRRANFGFRTSDFFWFLDFARRAYRFSRDDAEDF